MKYKIIPCNPKNYERKRRSRKDVKYIVIHYTGNTRDTADDNGKYFRNNVTHTSAHWFVDRKGKIVRSVPMTHTAWSVGGCLQSSGGGDYYRKCLNDNSVSIEMCAVAGREASKDQIKALKKLVAYVKRKCPKAAFLIRHYDVNGKLCPASYLESVEWNELKKSIICKGVK